MVIVATDFSVEERVATITGTMRAGLKDQAIMERSGTARSGAAARRWRSASVSTSRNRAAIKPAPAPQRTE
jgi:hypothetical protein